MYSAYEQAAKVYANEPCARTLNEDILLHIKFGVVVSTPCCLLLGRPVRSNGNPVDIVDPSYVFDDPDCWHIYLGVGQIQELISHEPFPLPWYSWERKNKLRFYQREKVIKYAYRRCNFSV